MIPPHTKNKYFPDVSNPWSYCWIGIKGTLAEQILGTCGLSSEKYILHHKVDDQLTSGELYFNKAIHFIHKNYFNNISISDIATAANIDRTYMFKLFQKYLKQSPSQYLQQYRLDKASILLRKSALSITDISYAVGFQHPPYFTKLFTQYKKVTPSEYRKGFLQQPDDAFQIP